MSKQRMERLVRSYFQKSAIIVFVADTQLATDKLQSCIVLHVVYLSYHFWLNRLNNRTDWSSTSGTGLDD